MKISILGLGYVGCVSSACLANQGHSIIGVDIDKDKVNLLNEGISPIIEPGLDELIKLSVKKGLLRATTNISIAIQNTNLSIICVGTPSKENGALDLTYVKRVCYEIGKSLINKSSYHHIVLRSTVLPGTTEDIVIPTIEEASGKKLGKDFGVAFNPEFLREGSAISDFNDPPKTVVGQLDKVTSEKLADIFGFLDAPLFCVPIRVAEAIKYADNAFHALKVSFANEIGAFCKANDIDSHAVMNIFIQDKKLNLSPYYLKPGDAFGGSCLPKDLRALQYELKRNDVIAPIISSILLSNEIQKNRVFNAVISIGNKNVGILGLSFKENTDDLRESPTIALVEKLIGKGYVVHIYDPILNTSKLVGSNRKFMEEYLPHIDKLLVNSLDKLLELSTTIVVTRKDSFLNGLNNKIKKEHIIVDLIRMPDELIKKMERRYNGIAW
ncbi:MAG: nucleotide sugar dehydrogenase [Candidatus Helarchaeota archaeon]